jgi:protoporphyrin/coproporphyrin ferrochelatase
MTAIVLLQMGGPSTLRDLRRFYQRLFSDSRMIQLPRPLGSIRPLLAAMAASVRARTMRTRYSLIGGGSPLLEHTLGLAQALEAELEQRGRSASVHVVMRYSEPLAEQVATQLARAGEQAVVLLPLYPHWSGATTGSSVDDFSREAHRAGLRATIQSVRAWGDDPSYVALLAERIEAARAELAREWSGPVHLLFSAHGLPVRYVQRGDPYPEQVAATARAVASQLPGFVDWRLSFQSRMGPLQWLQPATDRMLKTVADEGAQAVVVVPLGFVSDHIETLYDLDILYRSEAETLGIQRYWRVPAFNADPAFAAVLADILERSESADAQSSARRSISVPDSLS